MSVEAQPRRAGATAASGRIWLAAWLGAIAAGAALRLAGIREQVLGGDELHAVRAALGRTLGEILVTYQQADHSIPLTALYRLCFEAGLRPSELALRAPLLACGILLVALAPLAARSAIGSAAAARLAWLLALSPALVFYSRIVRSYAPLVLLAGGAAVAAWLWIEARSRRAAVAYVALAAAATWFHLLAAPFVVAPLIYALLCRFDGRGGPDRRSVAAVAAGLAATFAAFLLPGRESLLAAYQARRQIETPTLDTWLDAMALQAGSASPVAVALFAALAALGLAALWRERRRLALYTALLVSAQLAALLVLRPYLFHHALILNRYLLPCLPLELAWVAVGLGRLGPPRWRGRSAPVATALFLGIGIATGPFGDPALRASPFAHHNDFVGFHRPRGRFDPADVPRFYRELPSDGSADLVEMPWHPWWTHGRAIRAYQELHRGRVRVSSPAGGFDDPALGFHNAVSATPEALAATGAQWVVVHLDLAAEEARLREAPGFIGDDLPGAFAERIAQALRDSGARLAAELEAAWGPPDHADRDLRAWRLPRP